MGFAGGTVRLRLLHGSTVKAAVELLGPEHIDDHMLIHLMKQGDDIRHLVGRHHGVKQVHVFFTVSAHGIHTGYAVPEDLYIGVRHLQAFGGRYLQCHPLIAVMEGGYDHRGHKLKQNRISRIIPSEDSSEDT